MTSVLSYVLCVFMSFLLDLSLIQQTSIFNALQTFASFCACINREYDLCLYEYWNGCNLLLPLTSSVYD